MADYATIAQIKSIGMQTDALDETVWMLLAASASRFFDRLCEVNDDFFTAAAIVPVYTEKEFIGDNTAYLKLPPYTSLNPVDPVTINAGTVESPNFTIGEVPNYVVRGSSAQGYTMLVILGSEVWPYRNQIRVSANWGFLSIPSEVTVATSQLALAEWRRSDPAVAAAGKRYGPDREQGGVEQNN